MDWNVKLKEARKAKGLTQQYISEQLNVHRSTIANYELGRRKPTFLELKKIAEILSVDVNYLIEGIEIDVTEDLLTRSSVFLDKTIPVAKKDELFQEIMKLYLKGKSL